MRNFLYNGHFEEEAEIMILRSGDTLYYTRGQTTNFWFTNEELRVKWAFQIIQELYISYIIILSIIIKFLTGKL